METEHRIQRQGIVASDAPWKVRCDGTSFCIAGEGKTIKIDARREPHRVRISEGEIIVDMMRFSASPEAISAICEMLRDASRPTPLVSHPASSNVTASSGDYNDDLTALAEASLGAPSDSTSITRISSPTKYAATHTARFSSVGGMVGLVVMFLLPSRDGAIPNAVIGMICGVGGCGVGCAIGSFLDALGAGPSGIGKAKKYRSVLAVVALVLGIMGLIAWFLPIAGILVGIGGVVCGGKGVYSSRRTVALAGMGMSLACLLLSVGNGILGILVRIRAN